MECNGYTIRNDVYVNDALDINNEFEKKYIAVRKKEGRICSNDELRSLPVVAGGHPYFTEWAMRRKSADRLSNYLAKKNKHLNILEIGCGNGWLSNFLSGIRNSSVVGLDINFTELQQAAKVFKKENLVFVYDYFSDKLLPGFHFDVIVFAASVQYFSSIQQTIKLALARLNKDGEIHILDTNFYKADEVQAAKERTKSYYASVGFSEFSSHYYHHAFDGLSPFAVNKLYDPSSVKNIFERHKNPFLWLCVKERR